MGTKKTIPLLKLGDWVKIHYSKWKGRIVELRGPLAPGGVWVYSVRVPDKPTPIYLEVPENELTAIPKPAKTSPPASKRRRVKDEPKAG